MTGAVTVGPLSALSPLPVLSTTNEDQLVHPSQGNVHWGWSSSSTPFILLPFVDCLAAPPPPPLILRPPPCFYTDPSPDPYSLSLHVSALSQVIY